MALGTSPFSSEWSTHHRGTLNGTMTARVKIERVISEAKYNVATGQYDGGEMELLYLGRANIDRIARPTRREFVSDSADNQITQVQIPLDPEFNEAIPLPAILEFQSNDQLTILKCGDYRAMEGKQLYMRGDFGASEDWGQTLHFGFNSKES